MNTPLHREQEARGKHPGGVDEMRRSVDRPRAAYSTMTVICAARSGRTSLWMTLAICPGSSSSARKAVSYMMPTAPGRR